MAEAAQDGVAYEELIARIADRFPDRLRRRDSRIARRGAHLASRAFGERLAKAGLAFDTRRRFPSPRELKAGIASLTPESIAGLGLDLPAAPSHLQPDRDVARTGYDFATADQLLDVLRLARARAAGTGRLLYFDSRCGHAIRALLLALPGSKWLGVEATEEARAWAAAHIAGASFLARPSKPPLAEPDESFDGAVALDIARWSDPGARDLWLAELRRLVRPDGFMVASAPGYAAIAGIASDRRLPVATLEAACRALESEGRTELPIGAGPRVFYADAAFIDFPLKEHWRLGPQFAGAGPGFSDLYLLKRRARPLSAALPARKYAARVAGAAAVESDAASSRPWSRLLTKVLRPSATAPKRFVVLAMHRSGSTMVVATLNSHPAILCHGELFRRSGDPTARLRANDAIEPRFHDMAYRRQHPEEYLDAVYGIGYDASFVGFKLLSMQNTTMRDRLIEDERYVKILLRRDNVLARYSSDKVTRRIRLGMAKQGDRIEFDPEEFHAFHLRHDDFYSDARSRLADTGRPYLEISYIEACTPAGMRSIVAAIGADPSAALRVPTAKRNSSDVVSRFSNPDDVAAYLASNDLEHWREELVTQQPGLTRRPAAADAPSP